MLEAPSPSSLQTVTVSSSRYWLARAEAGGEGQVAADDSVAAHEAAPGVEDGHQSRPGRRWFLVCRAEELGHDLVRGSATGQGVTVGPVGADRVIVLTRDRGGPDDGRFLADRQMLGTRPPWPAGTGVRPPPRKRRIRHTATKSSRLSSDQRLNHTQTLASRLPRLSAFS